MLWRIFPTVVIAAVIAVFVSSLPVTSALAKAADKSSQSKKTVKKRKPGSIPPAFKDDPAYQQSAKLLAAISNILDRAAKQRAQLKELPSRENYVIPPLWKETREDREKAVRELLNAALAIVTDAPVVEMQEKLGTRRKSIAAMRDQL